MDLGNFVKQLFPRSSDKGPTDVAPTKCFEQPMDLVKPSLADSSPENQRPFMLPRLNTQEMRRMLSQIDLDDSLSEKSNSPKAKSLTEEDLGKQHLYNLSKNQYIAERRPFWEEERLTSPKHNSHGDSTQELEELELELLELSQSALKNCTKTSGVKQTEGIDNLPRLVDPSIDPFGGFISYRFSGNNQTLKNTEDALTKAVEPLGTKNHRTSSTVTIAPTQDPNIFLSGGNQRTFPNTMAFSNQQGMINQLDEGSSRPIIEHNTSFSTCGVFFGKATLEGLKPIQLNQKSLEIAQRLLADSPIKLPEKASFQQRPQDSMFQQVSLFVKASNQSNLFRTEQIPLQISAEAIARANMLFESPNKHDFEAFAEQNSNKVQAPQLIGFGKASTWNLSSSDHGLKLSEEALERAKKLFGDDEYTTSHLSESSHQSNNVSRRPLGSTREEIKLMRDNYNQFEKPKNPFAASSNPSNSLKPKFGPVKRSGAFVAPKQIKLITEPSSIRNGKVMLPKSAFIDIDPLSEIVREPLARKARFRDTAFTNKVSLYFEKYKQIPLMLAKRLKNRAPSTSSADKGSIRCFGSQFLTVTEVFEHCKSLLSTLGITRAEEFIRELTAELRLQSDKFDQKEEYVAHHLHMLSRRYIHYLETLTSHAELGNPNIKPSSSTTEKYSIFSHMLTDLYCRYKREEVLGSKPALRQLREGSINPERRLCLMLKNIRRQAQEITLEFTDGWYITQYKMVLGTSELEAMKNPFHGRLKADASNKQLILRLIQLNKLRVGDKVEISNLNIPVVAPEKLDEYNLTEPSECKIQYNSLKRCTNQQMKLGILYTFPKPSRLDTVYHDGGLIPLLDVIIVGKKGIKVIESSDPRYLTRAIYDHPEVQHTINFTLVVIDTIHICSEYAAKPIVYHEVQIRYQPLSSYNSYEIGLRLHLCNYKIARRMSTCYYMNYTEQHTRGFLLQESKRNCLQPKEMPMNPKKTVPLYHLLLDSKIRRRIPLDELIKIHFVQDNSSWKQIQGFLSIAGRYVCQGHQESIFHIYKTHFALIKFKPWTKQGLQHKKNAHKTLSDDQESKIDSSYTGHSGNWPQDRDFSGFWKQFVPKTNGSDRSSFPLEKEHSSNNWGTSEYGDPSFNENSYANIGPPVSRLQYPRENSKSEEDQTTLVAGEQKSADPLVVFFDLVYSGVQNVYPMNKTDKLYIHQFTFDPSCSFALGSNFITEFCESNSFEKYLLSQYQKYAQVGLDSLEGGFRGLLTKVKHLRLS